MEDLFTVADGVESRRPRADRADTQTPQTLHNAANTKEPLEVAPEGV